MITIALINQSTVPQDQDVIRFAAAQEKDLGAGFSGAYGIGEVAVIALAKGDALLAGAWPHYLLDKSDQAGDLAYHTDLPDVAPVMKTFCLDAQNDGVAWQVSASHEIKEALADPKCNKLWPDGMTAFEVCDPVEDSSYLVDGVPMSNHVLPSWLPFAGPGPYDALGHLTAPGAIEVGGYKMVLKNGTWQTIQAMRADGTPSHHDRAMARGTSRLQRRIRFSVRGDMRDVRPTIN